jgi:4-O-beta-D-mannosyl-D-glucose phosphorylase
LFGNGWIVEDDGTVFIYYASSDTRQHVAVSTIDRLLDYVLNTPEDGLRSAASVERLNQVIDNNLKNSEGGDAEDLKMGKRVGM